MATDAGWLDVVGDLFGKGIDAYADLERSKNYQANSTQLGTATGTVGQSAQLLPGVNNQTLLIVGAVALVVLLVVMRK